MAKAPGDVTNWDGSGAVWFKVYQITAVTDGGTSINWPASCMFFPVKRLFLLTWAFFI